MQTYYLHIKDTQVPINTYYIRPRQLNDFYQLQKLEKEVFGYKNNYLNNLFELRVLSKIRGSVKQGVRKTDVLLLKEEGTGNSIALLIYSKTLTNTIHIYEFGIQQVYQGKQLGTQLLQAMITQFKDTAIKKIILETRDTNIAMHKALKKSGFVVDPKRKYKYQKYNPQPGVCYKYEY